MQFGKNRVQYHRSFDEWSQYESENFTTYWYGQGRFIGQSAVMIAESDFEDIQKTLEYRLNDKLEIIVYSDITDLHQSNIGIDETFETRLGEVKVIGDKIFVHFDGDHTHLRRQVREGIAEVYINAMLFGSNLQEVVQNAISLNLPAWFKSGLVGYVGEEWNTDLDNKMRELVQRKKYKNFSKFAQAEPRLAGHAFWYFIAYQFGKANVSNLLYLTRINRSLDDALMYVMGSGYEPMSLAAMEFYRKRYEKELGDAVKVSDLPFKKIKNKFKLPLFQPKLSPDGKKIAYALNEIGKWKVYVQDLETGKRELILRGGTRNPFQATDYNYPLVAWNPDNQRLAIVYEKRDVLKLLQVNLKDEKAKKELQDFQPDFQRVYSIDFMNPRDMVISAAVKGNGDIYVYNTVSRGTRAVTNDFWDDLDATFVNLFEHKGVIFSSNRQSDRLENEKLDTISPTQNFDLFYKDLDDTARAVVRISATPDANERMAIALDTTFFSFLSDESGVANRQIGRLEKKLDRVDTLLFITNEFREVVPIYVMQDSARLFADSIKVDSFQLKEIYKTIAIVKNATNFDRNIIAQSAAPRVGRLVEQFYTEGIPRLNIRKIETDTALTPTFTRYWESQKKLKNKASLDKNAKKRTSSTPQPPQQNKNELPPVVVEKPEPKKEDVVVVEKKDTAKKVDIDNYVFQSEFDDRETPKTTQITTEKPKNAEKPIEKDIIETDFPPLDPSVFPSADNLRSDKTGHRFRQSRIIPYRLKFRNDFYSAKMDNNLLFGGLDSYAGTQNEFSTPPMGLLFKANFKDLLEDYQLEGGIRIPITFNGYEAYMFFDDRKKQLDKRFALYHRSTRSADNTTGVTERSRYQTSIAQYELRYPLDMFQRLQLTNTLRNDRYTKLATDAITLGEDIIQEQRIGAKLEWVYDNSLDIDMNIKNGTRAKVWVDVVKGFSFNTDSDFSFKFKEGMMGILGFDARHYERVLKHSVLAVRAAGATSFGRERTLHYLGGTDNELFARFDENVATPAGQYAFQTLAANMRGFNRNARNGTSYALINTELRVPIFKYLSSKPITSNFWRNFQLTGFFDIGTAWHGSNPFSPDNPLNTVVRQYPKETGEVVVLTVNYFKDPVVASYGVGARMLLLGYLIRADYGWGIETRQIQKPVLHIAIGTDF